MYSVISIEKDGNMIEMCECPDIESARKEAREYDYINKRDNNGSRTILVNTDDYISGNYDELEY